MTHSTFDQTAISAQLRTAGFLSFALAKPCYRHDTFSILGREAATSPQPGKQSRSRTSSSPRHNVGAGSNDWSMSCLPDTRSQQHACDYDEEESVIAEFLSGRQQISSRTSTAQSSCPQPHRQHSAVNASNRSTGSREYSTLLSAGSVGCPRAGALSARRHRAFTAYRAAGVSRAGSHSAGIPAALVAQVQWDGRPGSAPQGVAQLLSRSDSNVTDPSYSRRHVNSLQSQHSSSKAAHRVQHRAVSARSNRVQRSESYAGALRKRQAVHEQVPQPAVQQHKGTVSRSTALDLTDLQLMYKALLLKAFKQQPAGHCQSQQPETKLVSSNNNCTGQQFTAVRTLLGVHADAAPRAQPQAATAAALRPRRSSDSSGSVSRHQPATGKGTAATLFGALNAVTAANERAAAALSAAARQAKAAARVNQCVDVGASQTVSDDALLQMVTGWYRTAKFDSIEQDVSAQRVTPIGNNEQQQTQQQPDQQQRHAGAVEPTVVTEPSSSSTWSDGCPCTARSVCGVGYSWVGHHPSQQQQQFPCEQVCAGSGKTGTACEQRWQHGGLQHMAGDKVVSIAVLAGLEQPPLQELAKASSIIDELQHGLVDLRQTAEKLSHGDDVPVALRRRYGSPVQSG